MEVPVELKNKVGKSDVAGIEISSAKTAENTKSQHQTKFCKSRKMIDKTTAYGTGGRKTSIARVWVRPGKGNVTINKRPASEYFKRDIYLSYLIAPFKDTDTLGQYDVVCTATGGGTTGQAGAIRHGIARALDCISPDFHAILKKGGYLTRDSRKVERKKYGLRKSRKKAQFSKR